MRLSEITEAKYAFQGLYDVFINGKRNEQFSNMTKKQAEQYLDNKIESIQRTGAQFDLENTGEGATLTLYSGGRELPIEIRKVAK